MIQLFIKRSLVLAMFLSLFVACSSEITPVQAENSNTDTNAQTDAVADVIQLEDGNFLVEGDMIFTAEQLVSSNVLKKENAQSALFKSGIYEWGPNPTIEYYFVPANASQNLVSMNANAKRQFARALKDISNGVALSFKEVVSPSKHTVNIYTYSDDISLCPGAIGCAKIGKQSSNNQENFIYFSSTKGLKYETFIHEMFHVLGFEHEFQRSERDRYVNISSYDVDTEPENYGVVSGNTLNTDFDMASIMMYSGIMPKKNEIAYDWIGALPLMSGSDRAALKKKFGSETVTKNLYYIKSYSGRYLCRSTTGSNASLILSSSSASNLCVWDITTGVLNLQQTSQYSGIVLDKYNATTIRSTESTNYGGIYLSYQSSNNQLGLSVLGGGIQSASKWIPTRGFFGDGFVNLWNPLGHCLAVDGNNKLTIITNECSENDLLFRLMPNSVEYGNQVSNKNSLWMLYPAWSRTSPY